MFVGYKDFSSFNLAIIVFTAGKVFEQTNFVTKHCYKLKLA